MFIGARPRRAAGGSTPASSSAAHEASTGTPGGVNGIRANAISAAAPAIRRSSAPWRSRGASNARNAAGTTASSPNRVGSPSACAPTAPTSVARFQQT